MEHNSFTPYKISVRIGSDFDDLKDIEVCTYSFLYLYQRKVVEVVIKNTKYFQKFELRPLLLKSVLKSMVLQL